VEIRRDLCYANLNLCRTSPFSASALTSKRNADYLFSAEVNADMVMINHLKIDGVSVRSNDNIGIYEQNGKILFLYCVLGDLPKEQIAEGAVLPKYIVADFFSYDFGEHTQSWLMYTEKKTFLPHRCKVEVQEDCLLLNTMPYPPGRFFWDGCQYNVLAKLIEVRNGSLREIGESPEPAPEIYSNKKTFVFGDYTVRMASEYIMECTSRTTGMVLWTLRLHAWLYTDIEEKDGNLYFGTDGRGGRFYGVFIQDGSVRFAYNTGGTHNYWWYGRNVLVVDRKGEIVFLDSETGTETRRIALKNSRQKLYAISGRQALSGILIKNDRLYAVARSNTNKTLYNHNDFYAVCAEL